MGEFKDVSPYISPPKLPSMETRAWDITCSSQPPMFYANKARAKKKKSRVVRNHK
jgi:hypothetical protein